MMQTIADSIAEVVGAAMESKKALLGSMIALFAVIQVALIGWIPVPLGSVAFGIFAGVAMGRMFIYDPKPTNVTSEGSGKIEKEIIPYDKWPDSCYVCSSSIDKDMETRGQYVIHRGESDTKTKAVALCEECTWTYSTLLDNHDTLVGVYDQRGGRAREL